MDRTAGVAGVLLAAAEALSADAAFNCIDLGDDVIIANLVDGRLQHLQILFQLRGGRCESDIRGQLVSFRKPAIDHEYDLVVWAVDDCEGVQLFDAPWAGRALVHGM